MEIQTEKGIRKELEEMLGCLVNKEDFGVLTEGVLLMDKLGLKAREKAREGDEESSFDALKEMKSAKDRYYGRFLLFDKGPLARIEFPLYNSEVESYLTKRCDAARRVAELNLSLTLT